MGAEAPLMSDDKKTEPTVLAYLKSPDDYEIAVRKLIVDVYDLKEKDEENERFMRPLRWVFSKLAAGIGTAIGGMVTMYLTGWHPF